LLSFAAWRALIQLIYAPQRWEKTEHGLAKTSPVVKTRLSRPRPQQEPSTPPRVDHGAASHKPLRIPHRQPITQIGGSAPVAPMKLMTRGAMLDIAS
jgi:hypothetical protein